MGTRADFYVGRGKDAKWLGSIAWDGYPEGIDREVLNATTDDAFGAAVNNFLAKRKDATWPEHGWPWPWENSNTTDYAYAFDGGHVWFTGHDGWRDARQPVPNAEAYQNASPPLFEFPDMSQQKNVTYGKRSGLLVFSA